MRGYVGILNSCWVTVWFWPPRPGRAAALIGWLVCRDSDVA